MPVAPAIVVTTLVENSVNVRGLLAEHGLAFHIQAGRHSLLFETGQSSSLARKAAPQARLFLHPATLCPKFTAKPDGAVHPMRMHLLTASPERREKTLAAFRRLDIQRLAPAHCTGLPALARLWNAFPGRCFWCPVGARLVSVR